MQIALKWGNGRRAAFVVKGLAPVLALGLLAAGCTEKDSDTVIPVRVGSSSPFGNGTFSGGSDGGGGGPAAMAPTLGGFNIPGELPGTTVTLSGTDFAAGMQVNFGGQILTAFNISPTSADVVLPNLPPGDVSVFVVVGGLGSNLATYTMGPTLTALAPAAGVGGTPLTVTGTGLRAPNLPCPQTGLRGVDDNSQTFTPPTWAGNAIMPAGGLDVDSNGYFGVTGTTDIGNFQPAALPVATFMAQALFPHWDDLDNSPAGPPVAGEFNMAERTVLGVNTVILQWENFPHFNNIDGATFQCQLFEAGAAGGVLARFAYQDVTFGTSSDNGGTALIGYQQTPAISDQFSFNGSTPIAAGDIIDLTPTSGGGMVVDFAQSSNPGAFVDITTDSDVFLIWGATPTCVGFTSTTSGTSQVPVGLLGSGTVFLSVQGRVAPVGVAFTIN